MDKAYKHDFSHELANIQIRKNHLELWNDMFDYARNLNGNWQVSQEIFHKYLLPTAEENPKLFAEWVDKMVKASGLKLKCSANFFRTIRFMKRFRFLKKATDEEIRHALTDLFSSGLDEPRYARSALLKVNNHI